MNVSNKHETRKMYFENKGAGQVLLGAPEKELGGHPLRGREAGGGRSGSAREARWQVGGWGARQREWHGKGTADSRAVAGWKGKRQAARRDRPATMAA